MSVEMRKEVAEAARKATAALSRTWDQARVGSGKDPALERVVKVQIARVESSLWDATAILDRLIAEAEGTGA